MMSCKLNQWRPYGLAILTGFLLFWVTPPQSFFPIQWVSWIPFLLSLDQIREQESHWFTRSFAIGLIVGTLWNVVIFYWLIPTVADFSQYSLLISVIVVIFYCLSQGIAFGLMGILTVFFRRKCRRLWHILTPAMITLIETVWPRIFPWNIGWGQSGSEAILQLVSLFGMPGLTLWVLVINGILYEAWKSRKIDLHKTIRFIGIAGVIIGITWGFGAMRIGKTSAQVKTVKVCMIQADYTIQERRKEGSVNRVKRYIHFTKESLRENPDVIIWPESVVMGKESSAPWKIFMQEQRKWGKPALVGGIIAGKEKSKNRMVYFNEEGDIVNFYQKRRMVPFGEKMPFEDQFPWFQRLGPLNQFEVGHNATVFHVEDLKIGPLICQDGVFPSVMRDLVDLGADLVVYSANDSWFGYSIGNDLHFMHARIRAIEFGVPILRTANTGYSAFINSYGQVFDKTLLYEQVTWTRDLLITKTFSLYYHIGDVLLWISGFLVLGGILIPKMMNKITF